MAPPACTEVWVSQTSFSALTQYFVARDEAQNHLLSHPHPTSPGSETTLAHTYHLARKRHDSCLVVSIARITTFQRLPQLPVKFMTFIIQWILDDLMEVAEAHVSLSPQTSFILMMAWKERGYESAEIKASLYIVIGRSRGCVVQLKNNWRCAQVIIQLPHLMRTFLANMISCTTQTRDQYRLWNSPLIDISTEDLIPGKTKPHG